MIDLLVALVFMIFEVIDAIDFLKIRRKSLKAAGEFAPDPCEFDAKTLGTERWVAPVVFEEANILQKGIKANCLQ